MSTLHKGFTSTEGEIPRMNLSVCRCCGCWIDLDFGTEEPAAHQDAAGTSEDPRSPGDRDDICDVCDYAEERRQPRR